MFLVVAASVWEHSENDILIRHCVNDQQENAGQTAKFGILWMRFSCCSMTAQPLTSVTINNSIVLWPIWRIKYRRKWSYSIFKWTWEVSMSILDTPGFTKYSSNGRLRRHYLKITKLILLTIVTRLTRNFPILFYIMFYNNTLSFRFVSFQTITIVLRRKETYIAR